MKSAKRVERMSRILRWGVAAIAVLVVALLGATARGQSSTVEVLFRFPYGFNPPPTAPIGMMARARLLEVTPGQFFGTTSQGGTGPCNNGDGCGTVFVLDTSSTLTVLHHFQGVTAGDGAFPYAGLVYVPSDGHLYGTTRQGGDPTCSSPSGPGCGTIFRIMPDGSDYGVVYSFEAGATDGLWPEAALLLGIDGNLYGTTTSGGSAGGGGSGTLFKMTPPFDPPVTPVFYAVPPGGAVSVPSSLMQASSGTIYGIAGGQGGTIFSLDPATVMPTVLATALDGGTSPNGPLVDPGDGFLYGTARNSGANNRGTVFRFDTTALTVQTLYSFGSVANDGIFPQAGLALSADLSTLYGVTSGGGDPMVCGIDQCGTIFSILTGPPNPATTLHSFMTLGQAMDEGSLPLAELILGSDGTSFYGTTFRYGGNTCGPPPRACNGTVFRFTP